MKIATQKFLFIATIFLAVVLMVVGVVGYRQYVHAMACYVSCLPTGGDIGNTPLITDMNAVPTGYCGTNVTLKVDGVSQTSSAFSSEPFVYSMIKVRPNGAVIYTPKAWSGDNTDAWFLHSCTSGGYPLTYSVMASSIPSAYYLQSSPTYSGGNGTCTSPFANNCAYANYSWSCSLPPSVNYPPSQFTIKSTSSTPPCLSEFGFSLCSYGKVFVGVTVESGTGGSAGWEVGGPFDSMPPTNNISVTSSYSRISGSSANGINIVSNAARVGSYSITSVTPPGPYYTYSISPSSTQSITSCGQDINFFITFTPYCPAVGGCPLTPNGGICSGYGVPSVTYPDMCQNHMMTATCYDGNWNGQIPYYSSCCEYCAASGVCPAGCSCRSYSTSSATGPNTCSTYARTSTCSNGTWSPAPYAYSSCSQSCSTGSAVVSPSSITVKGTTNLSAPSSSWTGGTFLSSNTAVMTISGSTGTGEFAGSTTITGAGWTDPYGATSCPLSGATATVNGTYTIDPTVSAIVGSTAQDHGYYDADGSGTATTTQTVTSGPTWTSSNTGIATISSSGLATCISSGTSTITSQYVQPVNGITLTATGMITCSTAPACTITLNPTSMTQGNSSSLSWSSVGVSACTWTSGLSGDAGINESSTSVSPVATTTYAISCDSGAATCSATLGVLPACPTGYAVTATPNSIVTNGATILSAPLGWTGGTFSSSNTSVLTVSSSTGTGVAAGTATVTGTGWNVNTGAVNCPLGGTTVTVYQPMLSVMGSGGNNAVYIGVGNTATFTSQYSFNGVPSNNANVTASSTWSSNNTTVASSLGGGSFQGLNAGTASITANYAAQNMTATGTLNVVQCKATDVTITLRSGINTPMAGVPIAVSASAGTLTATGGTTDANGQFKTSLIGPIPASAVTGNTSITIAATADGVVLTKQVTFSAGDVCYANQIGLGPQSGSTLYASAQSLGGPIVDYFGKMFWTLLAPGKNK